MTLQELLKEFEDKIKNDINCQLPARVVKVNDDGSVNVVAIRNDDIEDCVITLPVLRTETSRAYIALKIKEGDRGVIKFCDRSIESYRKGDENYNGDVRVHSFSDGIFQLGFLPDNEKITLPDGEIIIGLKNKQFTLSVDESGNLVISSPSVTINAKQSTFNGNVSVSGTVTASADVIGGGISLKGHTHNYNPGPGSSTPTSSPQ